MNEAAVFFDLDGTICDIKRGMPDDTKEAIHRLRANGHKAFLCTGRSRAYLPKELSALNLDGMVAACGAYMEYQGHCIYNERMSAPVAKKTVEILRANGLVPVMEGWDYLYYDKEEYHSGIDSVSYTHLDVYKRQIGIHIAVIFVFGERKITPAAAMLKHQAFFFKRRDRAIYSICCPTEHTMDTA